MKKRFFLSGVALLTVGSLACFGCGGAQKEGASDDEAAVHEVVDEAEQYMGQAGFALSEGDIQTAMANYMAAAEIYDNTGKVTVERAEAHFLAADLAYQLSERGTAIEEYEKSVKIYVRFSGNSRIKAAVALNNMGTIYKELQNKSRALSCWNRALDIYNNAPAELKNEVHIQKIRQNIRDLEAGF